MNDRTMVPAWMVHGATKTYSWWTHFEFEKRVILPDGRIVNYMTPVAVHRGSHTYYEGI
jgi:hypothetical protein